MLRYHAISQVGGVNLPRSTSTEPLLLSVEKIWDSAPHNAFTDLARFRGNFYCAFRESAAHVRQAGRLRVLRSRDGHTWHPVLLASERGVDLRDPKLSVTADGRLMLLAGGTSYRNGQPSGRMPRVFFSVDGESWSKQTRLLAEGDWLWRVTWHAGRAYGVTYRLASARTWTIHLVSSADGVNYEEMCRLPVRGKPNETTVRFAADGTMIALVRRESGDGAGWIGSSRPPYREWSFASTELRLGGPNFIVADDGSMWAATRTIFRVGRGKLAARTVVGPMSLASLRPELELPSGGDCSYPGMIIFRGLLWISYYSSHEGKASIYIARVRLPFRAPAREHYEAE